MEAREALNEKGNLQQTNGYGCCAERIKMGGDL